VLTFVSMSSLPTTLFGCVGFVGLAGPALAQEWEDPNNATFGDDVHLDNSTDGLQTEFTIDSNLTAIGWQDLQQPTDNTLVFTFSNPNDQSTVLNYIGALHPSNLNGAVECDGCTVAFSNPYGIYVGGEAILDVGNLALIAGEIDQIDFLSTGLIDTQLEGIISNDGTILADGNVTLLGRNVLNNGEIQIDEGALLMLAGHRVAALDIESLTDSLVGNGTNLIADLAGGVVENNGVIGAPDATLVGERVANHGEIEIADGTLLMMAADAVWFRRFDDPISIKIPRADAAAESVPSIETSATGPDYAIENDGRIDAGLGHVRLSASDPLGFSIRQGTAGSIAARRIQLEGGESGRVELSGNLDASEDPVSGIGGDIEVTGSIIVVDDAQLDASGTRGGGTIEVGGEQEGQGSLQRADAVVVDEESTLRADALGNGDGGRVIVFSEGITSIGGTISATGGSEGGDGGFVETSGLARFAISKTPDVSAARGQAGHWLIDPFDICISLDEMGCGATEPIPNSLDEAIEAILDPDFDGSIFDSIIRTEGPSLVDPRVIAKALAVGTSVTLSTQVFGTTTEPQQAGNITIEDSILIPNTAALSSMTATLILLAANNITVDADILSGTAGEDANLTLNIFLRANDRGQDSIIIPFGYERIQGDVVINGDIDTGGGEFSAAGIAIHQDAASSITTHGGNTSFTSGFLDSNNVPGSATRSAPPGIRPEDIPAGQEGPFLPASMTGYAPVAITVDGSIDTSDGDDPGGDISLEASSVNVNFGTRSDVTTAKIDVSSSASLVSGGGDISLASGGAATTSGVGFAGNVAVEGVVNACALASCAGIDLGGNVTINANHINPDGGGGFTADFVEADPAESPLRGEGGRITIDVGPGGIRTGGGSLAIGGTSARDLSIDGELTTTSLMNPDQQGLMSIVALDQLAVDASADSFGEGLISIGTNGPTLLSSGGVNIEGRSVTTSNGAAGNPVGIDVVGSSSVELEGVTENELRIVGNKNVDFGVDTNLSAETVSIAAATQPTELTEAERIAGDPALRFRGTNGTGGTGVRINATTLAITTGDGTTSTTTLFEDDLVDESGIPTDFAVSRSPYGTYEGLQLESFDAPGERPDEIMIAQDAAFTISDSAAVGASELNLERAFDGRTIGTDGMRITLESTDGVLTITDSTALNNQGITVPGSDAGKSWVTLLGGLLLPVAPDPVPSPETVPTPNSVVFGADGGVSPLATPFDVEALLVSTPGDMTVNQQVDLSIGTVNELTFEAGRNTGVLGAAGRGTLRVGDATAPVVLEAGEKLSVLGGGSGFGDLIFEATPAQPITLRANDILLRAGGGVASLNFDPLEYSSIQGLASGDIAIRDTADNAFGSAASPADMAFRYQQDAAIDTTTDLPSLDQFGLVPADGFRDARDVVYSVRSDKAAIDLDDDIMGTNEGDRFRDSALSLIGTVVGSALALEVSDEFSFQGDSIEVGATGNFIFTQAYASAFNRSNTNPDARMTIRSGVGSSGHLAFDPGVSVVAARVDLIAGDGVGGGTNSLIDPRNATFDLSGANANEKTVVYQYDAAALDSTNLLTLQQFGGVTGAPNILVMRSDSGNLAFVNLDFATLPVDTTAAISRAIFEAETIRLTRSDAAAPDLDLESPNGLQLRLRANQLELIATSGTLDENGGRVLAGTSAPTIMGNDADFDADTLLIEGFDVESNEATVANLSSLSAAAAGPFEFDLNDGHGPNSISIDQYGSVLADDLPENGSISGLLARGTDEDESGDQIATSYSITSRFAPVALNPAKVNGSNLFVSGDAGALAAASDSAINFEAGNYDLDGLSASTEDSILILENTTFVVQNILTLAAGVIDQPLVAINGLLGSLFFGPIGGTQSINLRANEIELSAGPRSALLKFDGSGDEIDQIFLPRVRLDGLNEIERIGDYQGSSFRLTQSADLDLTIDANMDGVPDLVGGLENNPADATSPDNPAGLDWQDIGIASVQSQVDLSGVDHLVDIAENLTVESARLGSLVTDLEDHTTDFSAFLGNVLFHSNDITFRTDSPTKQIDLEATNLELRATATEADELFPPPADNLRFRLRDDPNALERPIVRIEQVADFDASSALPLPDQYTLERFSVNFDGSVDTLTLPRANLKSLNNLDTLDIELSVTGGQTLTLDDDIRDRVYGGNLILKSAGDVAIDVNGTPAGFDLIDAAALQFASLDIRTNYDPVTNLGGTGNILFTIAGFPAPGQSEFDPPPVMISSVGDQRFDGDLVLQETLTGRGRDITITGNVGTQNPDAGLQMQAAGKLAFQGDEVGSIANPLAFLTVLFENGATTQPNIEFGAREDLDGDGLSETPIRSDQTVYVDGDIIFQANNATAITPGSRISLPPFASIGKGLGDLTFVSNSGDFVMGTGEKLVVGGTATIDASSGDVRLGDAAALDLVVTADNIALARRATGTYFDGVGETQHDSGPTILANTIVFQNSSGADIAPTVVGSGKDPIFGVPDPFRPSTYPEFLNQFALFEIFPDGRPLVESDFRFASSTSILVDQVPALVPTGSSRSELSRAFGPKRPPHPTRYIPEQPKILRPERLGELGVEPHTASNRVRLARLEGAAVIDDTALGSDVDFVSVTESRLDASDVESAIEIYEELFGAEGEHAQEIREILQAALDRYLEETRVRRVIGFEFRRFVKNRPSTLIEAYSTLESLDALFRYHRRLGLSPGEYRQIQREWLRDIQPEGITLEEFAETVHPSRYVQGSDILDIFGQ
jgi:filamentous hemagglutinin family protein